MDVSVFWDAIYWHRGRSITDGNMAYWNRRIINGCSGIVIKEKGTR